MATLIINRNSEWAIKMRSIQLWLNGEYLGDIRDKEILEFELASGTYLLEAKIDWCGSRKLEVQLRDSEIRLVELTGFVFSKYLLPVALVNALLLFYLELVYGINSLILVFLMFFFFGYMLYFMSFGRKDYLQLKIKV